MKKPEFMKSERGVSPVIGVILMVAITVILAAVIGSFVLGIGGDVEKAPQASLTIDDGNLVHNGGDTLTSISITNVDNDTASYSLSEIGPGDEEGIEGSSGETIKVIHNPSDSVIWEGEYES